MRKSPFIWLGSGRTRKHNVARKARLLDQAAGSGLPVPSGGVLLDEFYQICLVEGLAQLAGGIVDIPDPEWLVQVLYRDVRFPRLAKAAAVRSGSTAPNAEHQSATITQLNVNFDDPFEVAAALSAVWSAMVKLKDQPSHDVLVMEMVLEQTTGEAILTPDTNEDHINLTAAVGSALPVSFTLQKIGTFQRATAAVPPYARRLQKLIRGFRRSFGQGEWRIAWADDGEICWLLQIL